MLLVRSHHYNSSMAIELELVHMSNSEIELFHSYKAVVHLCACKHSKNDCNRYFVNLIHADLHVYHNNASKITV